MRVGEVLRKRWHHDIWEVGRWLGRVLNGWLNYYAVPGSARWLRGFRFWAQKILDARHPEALAACP